MKTSRRAAGLLALAVTVSAGSAPAEETKGVVFAGVTLLDGTGGVRANATVAVRGGKVTLAAAEGRRIDVKGAYVTPGLIDCASRAGYAKGETESTREMTPDVDARDLADPWSQAFRDAARAGCTTVSLAPGPSNVVSGLARSFRTWTAAGSARPFDDAPQALWLAMASEPSNGNTTPRFGPTDSIYSRRPNTRMGVVWMLRQVFLDARTKLADPLYARYREVLDGKRACRVLAHRWQDMSATLRIADEVGLRELVFAGCEEAYIGRTELAKRKLPVIVGPYASQTSGEGADSSDTALRNAAMLRESGVRVALTAGPLGGARLREQAMLAVRWGLSKDDALAAVTSVAADLCGLPDRGRVAEGVPADLVLWSGHPLLPSSRALVVVVDGEIVVDETSETKR
jgi:imidazolonepropionase-like amidohydrolase